GPIEGACMLFVALESCTGLQHVLFGRIERYDPRPLEVVEIAELLTHECWCGLRHGHPRATFFDAGSPMHARALDRVRSRLTTSGERRAVTRPAARARAARRQAGAPRSPRPASDRRAGRHASPWPAPAGTPRRPVGSAVAAACRTRRHRSRARHSPPA